LRLDTVCGIISGVTRADKLLSQMTAKPEGDWRIKHVQTVCKAYGLTCSAPKRGDHYKVSHPRQPEIVTVPAQRPIKPIYIKQLVALVRRVADET
jgi:hypothetical protein